MKKMSRSEAGKLGAIASLHYANERHALAVKNYDINPNICKYCSDKIPYKKRRNSFCCRSCAASYNNRGVQRNPPKRDMRLKPCLFCSEITKNEKCCSRMCAGKLRRRKTYEKMKNGQYVCAWSGGSPVKRCIIDERGPICEECKRKTWRGVPIPLDMHHIDGDATNNLPSNLQLLCLNCHGITKNYGRKNGKSTRIYRYRSQSGAALDR